MDTIFAYTVRWVMGNDRCEWVRACETCLANILAESLLEVPGLAVNTPGTPGLTVLPYSPSLTKRMLELFQKKKKKRFVGVNVGIKD